MTSQALPPRLLVVDDIEDNRTILRRRFTRLGYQVMEAEDGEKALAMAATYPFDVVLLDVMMPGIDGLEVLRRLRVKHSEAALPIIMVTAKAASEDVVEALLMGANDYITKPVDLEIAAARVEMQLRRKRAEDRAQAEYGELEELLTGMTQAVSDAQNRAAILDKAGQENQGGLSGVLNAAHVLMRVCDAPDLKQTIGVIEGARASLSDMMVEAFRPEVGDRRQHDPDQRIHVLSADSDPARHEASRRTFAESGAAIEISEAACGKDAVAAAKAGRFDLILMNVDMADGLASIRKIRKAEATAKDRRRPIVALSEETDKATAALSAGADLHLKSPVTGASLLAALAGALRRESEDLTAAA
ncbi:response regulator [Phenylobacterium sp.]|uniref:response regulator n=1 Tax=Phenylobacterium sp. TaxID=1871053 RepID=UPI002DEC51BE|nr:response regulator [Phenylobacterium sp.]